MADTQVWDDLSQYFNVHGDEIDPGAADNILIAWPPMVIFLEENVTKGGSILEYGCGTGGFAKKLASLGYTVKGMDPAPKMIEVAQKHLPQIQFAVGDANAINADEKFDAITGVMVFQFESNLTETFEKLASHVNPGGCVVFAVFNPAWIVECIQKGILFNGFDNPQALGKGTMDFGQGRATDVYIRETVEYDEVMTNLGFRRLLEERPPYTVEFIEKYPTDQPTNVPEFLVLGYKKA